VPTNSDTNNRHGGSHRISWLTRKFSTPNS
jgi:hypothetical protein